MNDTLLVPAGFSFLSENAAQYALHLAQLLNTPVIFCAVFKHTQSGLKNSINT